MNTASKWAVCHSLLVAMLVGALPVVAHADVPRAKQAVAQTPLAPDASLQPGTIFMKKFVSSPNEAVVGELQQGWFCSGATPIRYSTATVNLFSPAFPRLFRQKLESLGYPVNGGATRSAFETEENKRPADFELGVTLKNFEARVCNKGGGETLGGVWMQLRWEVFSPRAQKVLLDITTEGTYQNEQSEKVTITEMFGRAFSAAAGNLLAQQAYFDLLHGKTAVPEAEKAKPIRIKVPPELEGRMEVVYQQLVESTLTLQDGARTGSGFLISADGYLLTNHHVVAGQKFMKVRFSNGSEQVAELVRSNRARDVALMKLSSPVSGALRVDFRQPATGEEAYAIGSPLGKTFAGTLTRGVVSGFRQLDGINYIQSDVRILPGSSGGPLFDGKNRVVGMTVSGVGAGVAGINLFIPIQEAFKALDVEIE